MYSDCECRTERARSASKNGWTAALVMTVLVATTAETSPWPPFLPPRQTFAPDLTASVEHVWRDPTLSRRVRGQSAPVPLDLYAALVDTPDVTAAAARFLKLSRDEVRRLGEDWYEADDQNGARGVYRVLLSSPTRRVMISWGTHTSGFLGTISGSALTVIDLQEHDGQIDPELTAYVRIDNRLAAALARILLPIFGHIADRKLREGFSITDKVARWALERPDEFCAWLSTEPLAPDRREPIVKVVPACRFLPQAARSLTR